MSQPGRTRGCSPASDYRLARGISRTQLANRTRGQLCSSLGIELNIWTFPLPLFFSFFLFSFFFLSPSPFFFFFPAKKLKTKPGSRRPLPTGGLEERGENRKLLLQEQSLPGAFFSRASPELPSSPLGGSKGPRLPKEPETDPRGEKPGFSQPEAKRPLSPAHAPGGTFLPKHSLLT